MSVRRDGEVACLEGACRVEEAEILVGLLSAGVRTVDLTRCETLHAAVAQVLLAWRPALRGGSGSAFLREWLIPALAEKPSETLSDTSHGATIDGLDVKEEPSRGGCPGTEGVTI